MPETGMDKPFTKGDLETRIEDFHSKHEAKYNYSDRNVPTELVNIRLEARGERPKVRMAEQPYGDADTSRALKRKRRIYFKEIGGFIEIPCYDGDKVQHGNIITGPAIVEERNTTIVIPPEVKVSVDCFGSYHGKFE